MSGRQWLKMDKPLSTRLRQTMMAKALPLLACASVALSLPLADYDCMGVYKTQVTCDADTKCAWCKSGAVKPACNTLEDAKSLPPSVFFCDKIGPDPGPDPKDNVTILADFGCDPGCPQRWVNSNDPVMGGRSTSGFDVHTAGTKKVMNFTGSCEIVPFLKAPGFCKVYTAPSKFPDVSSHFGGALHLRARTTTPSYAGYKLAFGAVGAQKPHAGHGRGAGSFKAGFKFSGTDWEEIAVPFTDFSIDWSEYTGECDTKDPDGTQHYCCNTNPEYCPTAAHLKAITDLEIWAEGIEGKFSVEVEYLGAGPLA